MTLPENVLTSLDSYPAAGGALSITGLPGDLRENGKRLHKGIDIAGPKGTPILSVLPGTIFSVNTNVNALGGISIIIKHIKVYPGLERNQIYWALYTHLDGIASGIGPGKRVNSGDVIGYMGNTGTSTIRTTGGDGTHLHFELYFGGYVVGNAYTWEEARVRGILPNLVEIVNQTSRQPDMNAVVVAQSTAEFKANQNYITPYITTTDSFEPEIQYELTRRRTSAETANVYMPFVKLTALTYVKDVNLGRGTSDLKIESNKFNAWCPTLGIHGEPIMEFDDIYSPQDNRSVVGYATALNTQGQPIRTKVLVEEQNIDATEPRNIPLPGIVSVTTDKSTAGPMGVRGGLFKANIKIVAYSVGQLNALLRYFLRPATRVVLEFGRMSSANNVTEPNITTFNWKRSLSKTNTNDTPGILDEIGDLAQLKASQRPFIEKYVYRNYGNYDILIGYVVNFKTKYTKDNIYEIDLTVHSVQQFEVPNKTSGTQPVCAGTAIPAKCKVLDVVDYFDPTSVFKVNNFTDLLIKTARDETNPWNKHVIPLRGQGTDAPRAGVSAPGFLLSWTFFVNKVLNDEQEGLLSIFQLDSQTDRNTLDVMRKSLLQPIVSAEETQRYANATRPNALISNEVGWHKNLRSTNPSTMVIYNESANTSARQEYEFDRTRKLGLITTDNKISIENKDGRQVTIQGKENGSLQERSVMYNFVQRKMLDAVTLTDQQAQAGVPPVGKFNAINLDRTSGVSSLTKGIWLNSNAIISAFTGTDTITAALEKLLTDMNAATEGYWNLQLLSNDVDNPGLHVIDMGLSKENNQKPRPRTDVSVRGTRDYRNDELKEFVDNNYLYLFNRKLTTTDSDDIGSELLDITLDIGLPQVVAVQAIAGVGGVASRATLQAIDAPELNTISLFKLYPSCSNAGSCGEGEPLDDLSDVTFGLELTATEINSISEAAINISGELPTSVNGLPSETRRKIQDIIRARMAAKNTSTGLVSAMSAAELQVFNRIQQLKTEVEQTYSNLLAFDDKFGQTFGSAIDFCEYDKTSMVKKIDDTRDQEKVHAFNSSNLTKTTVDLTMPGIAGIQLFQAFAVDRVPYILDKGYFVVTKVAHDFNLDRGWTTKMQGRFRYAPDKSISNPAEPSTRQAIPTQLGQPVAIATTPPATPPGRTATGRAPFREVPATPQFSKLGRLTGETGNAFVADATRTPPWRRK